MSRTHLSKVVVAHICAKRSSLPPPHWSVCRVIVAALIPWGELGVLLISGVDGLLTGLPARMPWSVGAVVRRILGLGAVKGMALGALTHLT